jgi:LuxR family transcriptional regulator, maltose regulon positive regulatory protein
MATPILATKLYVPPPRPRVVLRPRLIEHLNEGLDRKLTLVSAPAGFGKTTLLSGWVAGCGRPAAWLSLDEGDNDPTRFLSYLVAALRSIAADIGEGVLGALQSPRPPPTETVLTTLLNEISAVEGGFVLVLDDYHVVDAKPLDDALAFLLEHLPPRVHLVVATREDPNLPLARLRARGQLTELRASDLRFTPTEASEFLKGVMGLSLSEEDIAALETRTEGWIAGLQLAAISMRGHKDATSFIRSFTGGHHFVLDYLVEEVLQQQSESVQAFLLRTSILEHLCGPFAMPFCSTPPLPGKKPWNISSTPTCSSSPWTRSGAGTATIISSPSCCGSDCTRAPPRPRGTMWGTWPNYTYAPANGTKIMAWRLKLFSMRRPPMMSSAPSASLKERGCPCTFVARVPRY